MKKLLVLFSLLVVITLSGCASAPQGDYVTQDELDELELRLSEVESYLNRMVWVGYLLDEEDEQLSASNGIHLSLSSFEYLSSTEKDLLDKTKFPEYIWGLDGEYISVDELGDLLTQKYFGVSSKSEIGFQYKISFQRPSDLSSEEIMVRLSMLILELGEYDFYTLDSPELYFDLLGSGSTQYIKVRTSLLTTDKYTLTPEIFWGQLLDIKVFQFGYDESQCQAIYDQYILDGTFDGYVLPNYK